MLAADKEELYREFKAKAEAVAAEVYRVAGWVEARSLVVSLLSRLENPSVCAAHAEVIERLALPQVLAQLPGTLVDAGDLEKAKTADVGITTCSYGLAATGTVAGDATEPAVRLASMLPGMHIVLLPLDGLVANLSEVLTAIIEQPGTVPSYFTFITGPSRTADIERVLTIGVHGPAMLIVIIIDDWESKE